MKLHELQLALEKYPDAHPRFVLPDGSYIPAHAHVTEIGHVVKNFIDCGGLAGKEEKVILQTHVGTDTEHRLRADRLAKILELGQRVLPNGELDVDVEYDCCVVAQYPITGTRVCGRHLDLTLGRSRTQCRARERRESEVARDVGAISTACC
jgi:hypothetical protein